MKTKAAIILVFGLIFAAFVGAGPDTEYRIGADATGAASSGPESVDVDPQKVDMLGEYEKGDRLREAARRLKVNE